MSGLETQKLGFVHLKVHSSYSLLEGALPIGKLMKLAEADQQPALALTDTGNLFGALEFSEKAASSGVQPITGLCLAVDFADRELGRDTRSVRYPLLTVLAQSEIGYRNLMALTSHSYLMTDGTEGAFVGLDVLSKHVDGLIILTGGAAGPIDAALRDAKPELARHRLGRLKALFPTSLYVEVQRHGLAEEKEIEPQLLALAYALDLPLVATNECQFASKEDFESHDALVCIAQGRLLSEEGRRQLTPEFRFKTRHEMVQLFTDLPEAVENTIEIAQRCAYRPLTRKPILPRFTDDGAVNALSAEAAECRRQAQEGLKKRLEVHGVAPGLSESAYWERLEFELAVIERMEFPGYFLIVSDFIKWAKQNGVPVGPGRGSGAGSLVAWSLFITDLDPLRFALLFERFLNPERVSMPDFDIDFCQDRRELVIQYVQEKYGRDQVAQIITFGSLQARGVLRDVGRVLEMPYGWVDRLTKLVPQNPANPVTLAQAIADEPRLKEEADSEPVVRRLLDIALRLEGLYRHASTHAAGIVIADRPLSQLVPLYRDPKSGMPVTQFNMKWVEQAGLVKFDFLGLKTLTVLEKAVQLLRKRNIFVDLSALPLDDAATFSLLSRGETIGVFQLESAGMRMAIADIKPDRFEDIIALVALYRPGPMANIPVYGARKYGREEVEVLHPLMEPILRETYGIIVYQEQVMQIAQALSGYSLGEADLLRRAMGKKIREEMEKQRARFVSGALENQIDKAKANTIFELLAKFADYGFNKSHAAAYALVAYQTAYLKANYPVEFMAASMTLERDNTDKLADFREEAVRLSILVRPPCINESAVDFDVRDGEIIYPLAALTGVGSAAVEHVVDVRHKGAFSSLGDFARRINPRLANKRVIECLAAAGAFDVLEKNRARIYAGTDMVMATAQSSFQAVLSGQNELFGAVASVNELTLPTVDPWLASERLQKEHDAVGFFLSGHPLDGYQALLKDLRVQSWAQFQQAVRAGAGAGRLAGTVLWKQEKRTKSGNKMGIIAFSDPSGTFEAVCFQETLTQIRDVLEPGTAVVLLVQSEMQGDEVRVRLQQVDPLDQLAARSRRRLRVFLQDQRSLSVISKRLDRRGEGEVSVVVLLDDGAKEVEIKLKGKYLVTPQVAAALAVLPGVASIEEV